MRNVLQERIYGEKIITEEQEITAAELAQLFDIFISGPTKMEGFYNAIVAAFFFGCSVGYRNREKQEK